MTKRTPLYRSIGYWVFLVPATAIMDGFVHVLVGSTIVTGALVAVHAVILVLAGMHKAPPDHVV